MKFKLLYKIYIKKIFTLFFLICLLIIISIPIKAYAHNETEGERLFNKNCVGCHIKGGNIIRRNKTLKKKDLERNGLLINNIFGSFCLQKKR